MATSTADFSTVERIVKRRDIWPAVMLVAVVFVSALIVLQLAVVLGLGFFDGEVGGEYRGFDLSNYEEVFGDRFTVGVLVNSFHFSLVTLSIALAFGVPSAWLIERTDFRGKTVVFTLMAIGLLIPGFTSAMGWLFLMHPRVGLLNVWLVELLGLGAGPFAITSIWGMGWVQGLNLAPLAFIMTAAAFRAMDPALEEAAYMSGAGFRQTWLAVTARLVWPSILAASIYIFTIGFAAFDVPAIIGWSVRIYTFSTYLLYLLEVNEGLPRYGTVAALSTVVIVLAGLLSWWYGRIQGRARRYEVVTGKGYRPRIVPLGGWAWPAWLFVGSYFVFSKLLPLLVLTWVALLPYLQLPSVEAFASMSLDNFRNIGWDTVYRGLRNTIVLMVLVPTITLALSMAFSWIVLRSRVPGRSVFDLIAFLPHAVPNVVFSVAALLVSLFLIDRIVPIYGTIWILMAVFVIGRLSYGTRMTNGGLVQINRELEESALMSGADTLGVFRRVLLPLLTPTLLYAWLWMALLCFRELTLAVLLTKYENTTLPVLIWSMWASGQQGPAAGLGLIMLGIMAPIVGVYWAVARKRGLMAQG